MSPAGWLLLFLLGGALPLVPPIMRPGAGKDRPGPVVGLLLLDLLMVVATLRVLRSR